MIIISFISILIAILLIKNSIRWFKVGISYGLVSLFGSLFIWIIATYILIVPFVVIDNDNTIIDGKIKSIEKNFNGTYTITIKTDKNEKYCIENKEIIKMAKELTGEHVIIGKGKREGFYGIKYCHEAPIIHIERFDDVQSNDKNKIQYN